MAVAPRHRMNINRLNIKTTLVAAGALGAVGAAAYGVARAIRRRRPASADLDTQFDLSDLEEPVIVTEEVIVISEPGAYDADLDLIPTDPVVR